MKKLLSILLVVSTLVQTGTVHAKEYTLTKGISETVTYDVSAGQGLVVYKDTVSTKATTLPKWEVTVYNKTMLTNPSLYLANSDGMIRTDKIVGKVGTHEGDGSNLVQWYNYYIAIDPAWGQVGEDTITLRYNAF